MSIKVKTYVTSYTYDIVENKMYPDEEVVERELKEVKRLLQQGHTVEYRFGDAMSTVLDMDKFKEFLVPLDPEYNVKKSSGIIIEDSFQRTLESLTPRVEETTPIPIINEVPPVTNVSILDVAKQLEKSGALVDNNIKEIKEETKVEEKEEVVKNEVKPVEIKKDEKINKPTNKTNTKK